jgi:hypothetical protein
MIAELSFYMMAEVLNHLSFRARPGIQSFTGFFLEFMPYLIRGGNDGILIGLMPLCVRG